MILDLHLRWKGEEDGNPGPWSRNMEWFTLARGSWKERSSGVKGKRIAFRHST